MEVPSTLWSPGSYCKPSLTVPLESCSLFRIKIRLDCGLIGVNIASSCSMRCLHLMHWSEDAILDSCVPSLVVMLGAGWHLLPVCVEHKGVFVTLWRFWLTNIDSCKNNGKNISSCVCPCKFERSTTGFTDDSSDLGKTIWWHTKTSSYFAKSLFCLVNCLYIFWSYVFYHCVDILWRKKSPFDKQSPLLYSGARCRSRSRAPKYTSSSSYCFLRVNQRRTSGMQCTTA